MNFTKQKSVKRLKKNRVNVSVVFALILLVIVSLILRQQRKYTNNPGLIPPKGDYDIQVVLTDKQKDFFEENLKKYDDLIKNFVPGTWSQEIEIASGIVATRKDTQKPAADRFIEKARALENLGRYSEAIRTYNEFFSYYPINSVGRINLWELYETLKKPEMAILQYQKLLEEYPNFDRYYYKKIVRLYLKLNDPEQAGQRYIKYELIGWTKDEELMNQIKEMKAELD